MKYLVLIMIVLIWSGCTAPKKMAREEPPPVFPKEPFPTPAGVDTAVARYADSLSDSLFVNQERRKEAEKLKENAEKEAAVMDTLWIALTAVRDSATLKNVDTLKNILKFNEGVVELNKVQEMMNNPNLSEEELEKQIIDHFQKARKAFEGSIIYNPFDESALEGLAIVYQNLGQRFEWRGEIEKAIEIYKSLALINQDQHTLFATIGNNYLKIAKTSKALDYFKKAEDVLLQTAIFNTPDSVQLDSSFTPDTYVDSTYLFNYVYMQADIYTRLYNASAALAAYSRARALTADSAFLETIQVNEDWINWDNGNIRATEIRDTIFEEIEYEEYVDAAARIHKLLNMLNTQRAFREMNWRLASLEYGFFNKKDSALIRMKRIYDYYQQPVLAVDTRDTLKSTYFNTYGTMLYNEGIDYLKERNYKTALAYFQQAAEVPWKEQGRALFEILKLSRNSPRMAIRTGKKVMEKIDQLRKKERRMAYGLFITALKRTGEIEEAIRWFREYKQLQLAARIKKGTR